MGIFCFLISVAGFIVACLITLCFLATLFDGLVARYGFWIPAFAGSERGIRIACDPPTQQSSQAGDGVRMIDGDKWAGQYSQTQPSRRYTPP
jgi:hypothetical protein